MKNNAFFFVTIDVFGKLYIRSGNVRSFIGVVENRYALVSQYNIQSRVIYRVYRYFVGRAQSVAQMVIQEMKIRKEKNDKRL